jgi:hypothetical protein
MSDGRGQECPLSTVPVQFIRSRLTGPQATVCDASGVVRIQPKVLGRVSEE